MPCQSTLASFSRKKYQRKTDLRLFWKINASIGIDCESNNNKGVKHLIGQREAQWWRNWTSTRKVVLNIMYFYLLCIEGVSSNNNKDGDDDNNNTYRGLIMSPELFKHFICVNSYQKSLPKICKFKHFICVIFILQIWQLEAISTQNRAGLEPKVSNPRDCSLCHKCKLILRERLYDRWASVM